MTRPGFRIIIRARAERDIDEAALWYEQQRPSLGRAFVAEVDSTIARAAASPLLHACLLDDPEVRRVFTKRFPYRIFFVCRDDEIVVFRVLHAARHDREWRNEIPAGE